MEFGPSGSKWSQIGFKWFQMVSKRFQMVSNGFKLVPNGFELVSNWVLGVKAGNRDMYSRPLSEVWKGMRLHTAQEIDIFGGGRSRNAG